jgi:hypothetical protein
MRKRILRDQFFRTLGLLGVILLLTQALACSEPKSNETSKSETKNPPPAKPAELPKKAPKIPSGEPYTFEEAGLKFEIPNNWKAEKNESGYPVVTSGDGSLIVKFDISNRTNFDQAAVEPKQNLQKDLKNIKQNGSRRQYELNGLATTSESGTGDGKDGTVLWSIDFIEAGKPVILYSLASEKLFTNNIGDYYVFINSMKKADK